MITIQKENKQYDINENQLDLYLSQGFSQVDGEGKVIKAGEATTLTDVKAENDTLKAKLAEYKDNSEKLDQFEVIQAETETLKTDNQTLKLENDTLKVENAELKVQLEAANKKATK